MRFAKLAIVALGLGMAYGQTCQLPPASQWEKNILTENIAASVAMSIGKNKDVFIAEMLTGNIKLYVDATGQVVNLGKVDNALYIDDGGVVENGLLGVAADPNYEENKWIYVFYSKKMSNNTTTDCRGANVYDHKHFLVRFTVENNQLTNKKDLLSFQRGSTSHAAGGLTFDKHGDFYLSTGDDSNPFSDNGRYGPRGTQSPCNGRPANEITGVNALATAGNTNDLRGKVLRITPIPFPDSENPSEGVGSTYNIPEGNLFDEAEDTENKTRPEILSMGHRNPYRIRVDSITGWVFIGEVGPDAADPRNQEPQGHDEFNLVTEPANFGWPFANANNQAYKPTSSAEGAYNLNEYFDLDNLQNLSPANTGLTDLPPATPALSWYNEDGNQQGLNSFLGGGGESAIGGPRYWYDSEGDGLSPNRMPPYFQGKFIGGDWVRGKVWVFDVDSNGVLQKIEAFQPSGNGNPITEENSPIDFDMGPDGVLYALYTGGFGYSGWQTGGVLARWEYTGPQYDISECEGIIVKKPDPPVIAIKTGEQFMIRQVNFGLKGNSQFRVPMGASHLRIFDLAGREIHSINVSNQSNVKVELQGEGLYYAKFE